MFVERLGQISKRIEGSLALSLVDGDGIQIESVSVKEDLDLELLAAELVAQIRSLTASYAELDLGELDHYSIATEELTIMVSSVVRGYYLLLVLGRGSNRGRARFELHRARLLLEKDLR